MMISLKDPLIGRKVRRVHPGVSTPNSQMVEGEIYTITDSTLKEPRRIALKETGPCYWALLDAFEFVYEETATQ